MNLTPEQLFLFRHNGFLQLPIQLSQAEVTELQQAIWHDIRQEIEPVNRDRNGQVVRISNLWDRKSVFQSALASDRLLDLLESLLGPNIEFVKNRHNHATLRGAQDSSYGIHRDILQWTRTIVTVIFYLQETTIENGCTWVIPGSHLFPAIEANQMDSAGPLAKSGAMAQKLPVPMPAGGMLVIDSMLMHTAGVNQTKGTRMSMTAGYHSVDELSGMDNPRRALVRGDRIYRGNDA